VRHALLIVVLIVVSMLTACEKAEQKAKQLPMHGPGEVDVRACKASSTHGNKPNYQEIDCPEACATSITDHKWTVDGYVDAIEAGKPIDASVDPDVCLHGATDTLTYSTKKNGRAIQVMRYESAGQEAHPFQDPTANDGPPFPRGNPAQTAKTGVLDPSRRPDHSRGKCYIFEAYILVKETGQNDRCFDPHIYTDCDPSCTLLSVP